jgi:hypothetical protein
VIGPQFSQRFISRHSHIIPAGSADFFPVRLAPSLSESARPQL